MASLNLRSSLQEITTTWDIEHHPQIIEALRSQFPHTIEIYEQANPAFPRNCFEWALNLDREVTHWVCDFGLPELFAVSKFVLELVLHMTEISESDTTDGDLVLYFDNQIPTHAGMTKESRVISKWGKGHIYQHDLLEVPTSYGNEIRFYRNLPASIATTRFIEYVQDHPDYNAIREMFEEKFHNLAPKIVI